MRSHLKTLASVTKTGTVCLLMFLIVFCGKKSDVYLLTENKCIIKDQRFQPVSMTVVSGSRVTWVNEDTLTHRIVSGLPSEQTDWFRSEPLESGDSFSYVFDSTGTFPYFNKNNPDMLGVVIVREDTLIVKERL